MNNFNNNANPHNLTDLRNSSSCERCESNNFDSNLESKNQNSLYNNQENLVNKTFKRSKSFIHRKSSRTREFFESNEPKPKNQQIEDSNIDNREEKNQTILSDEGHELLYPREKTLSTPNLNTHPSLGDNNDETMSQSSASNRTQNKTNTRSSSITKLPPPSNSPNLYNVNNSSNSNYVNYYYNNKDINTKENKRSILPNLSAVKRTNVPMKGLAFKEAKQRIIPNDENVNNSELMRSITAKQARNIRIEPDKRNFSNKLDNNIKATANELNTNNVSNTPELTNRPSYKDMLKGIKKGVTLTSNSTLYNENTYTTEIKNKHLTTSFSANPRVTTTAVKQDQNVTVRNQVKHKNYIKILRIKGAKIPNLNVKQVLVTKLNSTKNSKIDTILNEGINTDLDAMYDGNSNNHNNESRLIRISINNTSSLSLIPNSRPINPTPEEI